MLFQLHWLPIEARVIFKVLLTVHRLLHHGGPNYLRTLLVADDRRMTLPHGRETRSSGLLVVPFSRSAFIYERAFSVAGPRLWNSLPQQLRDLANTEKFKRDLKTYLFKRFYSEFC